MRMAVLFITFPETYPHYLGHQDLQDLWNFTFSAHTNSLAQHFGHHQQASPGGTGGWGAYGQVKLRWSSLRRAI